MNTIIDALANCQQRKALAKYLEMAEIKDWSDISKASLYELKDCIAEAVSPNSLSTYLASLRSVLARYEDEVDLPKGWRDILSSKREKPAKTFLTKQELTKLESVEVRSLKEQTVLYTFLVSAYTGCRVSDAQELTTANIDGNTLTYVSKKTSIKATVPCTDKVRSYIEWLSQNAVDVSLMHYNRLVRQFAEKAGIDSIVTIYHAGATEKGEKYKYLSSHSGRISFATNLARLKVPILDISRLMGHTSTAMTERYIVRTEVELSRTAMAYFM